MKSFNHISAGITGSHAKSMVLRPIVGILLSPSAPNDGKVLTSQESMGDNACGIFYAFVEC